jgi:hypothetical protein
MNSVRHYTNLEQLKYVESLCKRPLVFYHEVEASYPEIEIQINRNYKPSNVKDLLEPVLRKAGYSTEMIELEAYDKGERGCNELVLLLDLKLFNSEQIIKLISIVKDNVSLYASLTDTKN